MKGKIFNFRNIVIGIIILVIITISGINIVEHNTRNVQTNLGEAVLGTNSYPDNSANEYIVRGALNRYKSKDYMTCSDLVDGILGTGSTASDWYNNGCNGRKITIEGKEYKTKKNCRVGSK